MEIEKEVNTVSYTIIGNDFEKAGSASQSIKQKLKKIGVDPETIRRTIIAAYEAEMNVVIYAYRGTMDFTLSNNRIEIRVEDEGPGIKDINKAMLEGYSTASPFIREMGFGAGLGLPNIKKSSDHFEITSIPGKGTCVNIIINLKSSNSTGQKINNICTSKEKCNFCLRCIKVCPTGAIRVKKSGPVVLTHLCIDCTRCIKECKTGALSINYNRALPEIKEMIPLIVHHSFFVQFGEDVTHKKVIRALKSIGFSTIRIMEDWEKVLKKAVSEYTEKESIFSPVISPLCPAVLNLIQIRFPSLIRNIAPFLTPIEMVIEEIKKHKIMFVPICPCQCSLLEENHALEKKAVSISSLFHSIIPILFETMHKPPRRESIEKEDTILVDSKECEINNNEIKNKLTVTGIENVTEVLEKLEYGFLKDFDVIELYACEQGCFGSPLLRENPFLAKSRWERIRLNINHTIHAVRREKKLRPREGLRLDENMAKAIEKLAMIDRLTKKLPQKNCSRCGAPDCNSFAEDVVMGRASLRDCIYYK